MRSESHFYTELATDIEPSAFALTAPSLIRCGYSPLPIVRGGKAPGIYYPLKRWQAYCDNVALPNVIRGWSQFPGIGVGVACGRGLIAVDIDQDELVEPILAALPLPVVTKKGRKGLTAFYSGDTQKVPSRSFSSAQRGGLVDLLSWRRQTVLPPSIHPDTGQSYTWLTDRTLLNTPQHLLTELPDDVADRIGDVLMAAGFEINRKRTALGWAEPCAAPAGKPSFASGDNIYRKVNDLALASLHLWVPALNLRRCYGYGLGYRAVSEWRLSGTGRPFHRRAANLHFTARGIRDFGTAEGYTPIDVVMAALRLSLDDALDWLGTRVDPGWNEPLIILTSGKYRREPSNG